MMSIFLFIIGLFFGSFLLVVADRIVRNESVVRGRSYCESCKKTIAWYDLLPLMSFFFLRGRCRYCKVSLSRYYPLAEIVTASMFVLTSIFVFQQFGDIASLSVPFFLHVLFYLYITASLVIIFFADLRYGIIPNKIVYPAVVITLLFFFLTAPSLLVSHTLAAVGAFLFFFILFFLTKGRGMGFGDVKFVFLMGLLLGFPLIVFALYAAFLTGGIVSLILVLWGKKKFKGGTIVFGPFLVVGTFLALFLGHLFLQYLNTFLSF